MASIAFIIIMATIPAFIYLFYVVIKLNNKIIKYKTAMCCSAGRLGKIYQRIKEDKKIEEQEVFDAWDILTVYSPQEDTQLIYKSFYIEIKDS